MPRKRTENQDQAAERILHDLQSDFDVSFDAYDDDDLDAIRETIKDTLFDIHAHGVDHGYRQGWVAAYKSLGLPAPACVEAGFHDVEEDE